MRDRLGVAILGCGYWGINYLRVFRELPRSRVVVVCDQRRERLRELRPRFRGVHFTTDLDEALRMEGVDAAVVCTPAVTHHRVARQCLLAGKHVLIEKPITVATSDADELIAMAAPRRLALMVGHIFIYNPAIAKVKEYVDRGEVGRIYYLYARRTNMGPIRHDVNALWDLASHDVSIFNHLLDGAPLWVSAVGAKVLRSHQEDVGFISLGYPANILCHIHASWADAHKVREVVVVGSEKRIVFNDFNSSERVRVFEKGVSFIEPEAANYGEYQLQMHDGDIISPRVEVSEPLRNQCNHFLDCMTQGVAPLTDGAAGREVVRVLEAIEQSIASFGAPVRIGRESHDDIQPARYVANSLR
jgi:predicted dehydrogenase